MIQNCGQLSHFENCDMRLSHRELSERVLDKSIHLPTGDRVLVEQLLRYGFSIREIARLTEKSPSSVSRRMKSVMKRMDDPMFEFVVNRSDFIPRESRVTARLVYVEGFSLRESARKLGVSLHEIRKRVARVRMAEESFKKMRELN